MKRTVEPIKGQYQDRAVAILGFGRAGRAATDFLLSCGARLCVYDTAPLPADLCAPYRARGVVFCDTFPAVFGEELLVRSPVIRPDHPAIAASRARGARVMGETDLLLLHAPATVIGVTGSDGKTTTSALIAALLRGAGHRTFLGGNNGVPLLPRVGEMRAGDFAVVELSSFQLMDAPQSPDVAVITNITPNHLNWHTDMAEYVAAKTRIFKRSATRLVTNADCAITRELAAECDLPVTLFGVGIADTEWARAALALSGDTVVIRTERGVTHLSLAGQFHLPGKHNRENLMAALGAVLPYVSLAAVEATLPQLRGVAHRLQYVDTVRGVAYYNSSIDTSPTRTAAALSALSALSAHPLVIAGGRGKGVPLSPLGDTLATLAKAAFLYGETAEEIASAVRGRIPVQCYGAFADAFRAAARAARAGDTVLLSPGCTAFDQFRDFEERGEYFCRLVEREKQDVELGTADPADGGDHERDGI